jgi:Tfp pilus assembly protein PilF
MGLSYMRANKLDEALKAFQAAIKADPSSAQAHNNLGVVYERRGLLNQALAEYKKAVQLDSALADAKTNLSRFGKQGELKDIPAEPTAKKSTGKPTTKKPTKKANGR